MRLLRNPESAEGVTPPAPTPEPPKPEVPPTPPPAPPAPNPLVADLAALRAQVAEFEREKAERERIAREAEEETLRKKGEFEKLIKNTNERLEAEKQRAAAAEDRAKAYALSTELALAFSNHDLVEGSAEDLTKLWREDFEAVPDGDRWSVRAKDGRTVKEVVAERLTSQRYSNHVKAQARSGSGGGGGHVPSPTPNSTPEAPADPFARHLQGIASGRLGAPGLAGTYGVNNN